MYNQPKPYSVFSEIPTTPQASSDTLFSNIMDDPQQPQSQQQPSQIQLFSQQKMEKTSKMNDMTPSPTSNGNNISNHGGLGAASLLNQPFIGQQQQPHTNHQHHPLQHKRSYSQMDEHPSTRIFDLTATVSVSSLSLSENRPASCHLTATPTNTTTGLSLYVNVKTTQHQRFHSPPSPTTPGTTSGTTSSSNPAATSRSRADKKKLQYIVLDHITVQELIIKLCPVLSLHYSQVSEVLWRQPKSTATPVVSNSNNNNTWDNNTSRHCHSITTTSSSTSTTKASLSNHRTNGNDGTLVRVDDKILASSFTNDSVVGVEWEIKSDGTVRLLLQQ
ncbi:hypothetical protein BDA99DRAFT_189893 [Phascolomyces articulosus]|uniref:Uncharacterized protein n=1 Tax=Phascolomyces articulosus TaxID=60185 RepID=A0AAD5K9A6_9FUNG|nr:hypothetical protein BDA99DRAFT_189893 [Phascolomyces articulosus]